MARDIRVTKDPGRKTYSVYIDGRRLAIGPRTKEQAERIAADMRGEHLCEHRWVRLGRGFYVCELCGGKRFDHGSVWAPKVGKRD